MRKMGRGPIMTRDYDSLGVECDKNWMSPLCLPQGLIPMLLNELQNQQRQSAALRAGVTALGAK